MNELKEIWKDISKLNGKYQISTRGRIKSCYFWRYNFKIKKKEKILREKILSPGLNQGYFKISLLDDYNCRISMTIHRLVALTFIENPKNLPEINHIDAIKTNNNIENLEWCSRKRNMQHAHEMGIMNMERGTERYNVKLTEEKVKEIRKLEENKIPTRKIAKLFGISRSTVMDIVYRRRWKHV